MDNTQSVIITSPEEVREYEEFKKGKIIIRGQNDIPESTTSNNNNSDKTLLSDALSYMKPMFEENKNNIRCCCPISYNVIVISVVLMVTSVVLYQLITIFSFYENNGYKMGFTKSSSEESFVMRLYQLISPDTYSLTKSPQALYEYADRYNKGIVVSNFSSIEKMEVFIKENNVLFQSMFNKIEKDEEDCVAMHAFDTKQPENFNVIALRENTQSRVDVDDIIYDPSKNENVYSHNQYTWWSKMMGYQRATVQIKRPSFSIMLDPVIMGQTDRTVDSTEISSLCNRYQPIKRLRYKWVIVRYYEAWVTENGKIKIEPIIRRFGGSESPCLQILLEEQELLNKKGLPC